MNVRRFVLLYVVLPCKCWYTLFTLSDASFAFWTASLSAARRRINSSRNRSFISTTDAAIRVNRACSDWRIKFDERVHCVVADEVGSSVDDGDDDDDDLCLFLRADDDDDDDDEDDDDEDDDEEEAVSSEGGTTTFTHANGLPTT